MFPKVPDYHKRDKRLVSNGLGVVYVVVSATYLFLVYYFRPLGVEDSGDVSSALTLAVCVLFGGFMGLIDDWMDLKWRYKAFFPLIASIPLAAFATRLGLRTAIAIPLLGAIDFGVYYYFVIIPIIVTVATNTVNQLGGLNGLETVCPAIVLVGLMVLSGTQAALLYVPLAVWLLLAFFNLRGRIFVGNVGSFAIGMTIVAFAIMADLKSNLLVSLLPYILNSSIILLSFFLFRTKAAVSVEEGKLVANHRRSLVTIITYHRPFTERQVVAAISLMVTASTLASFLV